MNEAEIQSVIVAMVVQRLTSLTGVAVEDVAMEISMSGKRWLMLE